MLLPQSEIQKVDQLIGAALFDGTIQRRLVEDRDQELFEEYGLRPATVCFLRSLPGDSLSIIASSVLKACQHERV